MQIQTNIIFDNFLKVHFGGETRQDREERNHDYDRDGASPSWNGNYEMGTMNGASPKRKTAKNVLLGNNRFADDEDEEMILLTASFDTE